MCFDCFDNFAQTQSHQVENRNSLTLLTELLNVIDEACIESFKFKESVILSIDDNLICG